MKTVIKKYFDNKKYHQNRKKKKVDEDGPHQEAAGDVVQPNNRSTKQVSSQWKQTLSEAGFSANKGMSASSLQNKSITTPSFPERNYNNFTLNTASSTSSLPEWPGIFSLKIYNLLSYYYYVLLTRLHP